jgi:phosphoglycerol transferase MdoB-like AlkP superfamily enzyme
MSTQPDPPDNEKPQPKSGGLGPLVFWVGLPAFMFVCKLVEDEAPGYGKWLFIGALLAGVVSVILYLIVDKNLKNTAANVLSVIKWVVILVAASFVLSWCSGGHHTTEQPDIYYRK